MPESVDYGSNITAPHPHDVLCGRGGGTNAHIGNAHWRLLVQANKELYLTLPKKQKMLLSKSIVNAVRNQHPPGRFLQKDPSTSLWSDVGDSKAQEKTSQALREGAPKMKPKEPAPSGPQVLNTQGRPVESAVSSSSTATQLPSPPPIPPGAMPTPIHPASLPSRTSCDPSLMPTPIHPSRIPSNMQSINRSQNLPSVVNSSSGNNNNVPFMHSSPALMNQGNMMTPPGNMPPSQDLYSYGVQHQYYQQQHQQFSQYQEQQQREQQSRQHQQNQYYTTGQPQQQVYANSKPSYSTPTPDYTPPNNAPKGEDISPPTGLQDAPGCSFGSMGSVLMLSEHEQDRLMNAEQQQVPPIPEESAMPPPKAPPAPPDTFETGMSFGSEMPPPSKAPTETAVPPPDTFENGMSFGSEMPPPRAPDAFENGMSFGSVLSDTGKLEHAGFSFGSTLSIGPIDHLEAIGASFGDMSIGSRPAYAAEAKTDVEGNVHPDEAVAPMLQYKKSQGNLLDCSDSEDEDDGEKETAAPQADWAKMQAMLQQYAPPAKEPL